MQIIKSIQNRIYEIRGERVMLDQDLAGLYETETESLNLTVKRNLNRFPEDFMFQLTKEEYEAVKFQIKDLKTVNSLGFRIETSKGEEGNSYLPFVFTEKGIAMLSCVLNSDKAIQMSISIMRALAETRRIAFQETDLKSQLQEIRELLVLRDGHLSQIYEAIENLLDENAAQKKWNERERIGFKK